MNNNNASQAQSNSESQRNARNADAQSDKQHEVLKQLIKGVPSGSNRCKDGEEFGTGRANQMTTTGAHAQSG